VAKISFIMISGSPVVWEQSDFLWFCGNGIWVSARQRWCWYSRALCL